MVLKASSPVLIFQFWALANPVHLNNVHKHKVQHLPSTRSRRRRKEKGWVLFTSWVIMCFFEPTSSLTECCEWCIIYMHIGVAKWKDSITCLAWSLGSLIISYRHHHHHHHHHSNYTSLFSGTCAAGESSGSHASAEDEGLAGVAGQL